MAACSTPLTAIQGTDCIGDSRAVINNNFTILSNDLCGLQTTVNNLTGSLNARTTALSAFVKSLSAKDSSTIDLAFDSNFYFLSGDVINNSLGTNKLGGDVTTFGKRLLSSNNIPLSSLGDVQLSLPLSLGESLKWDGNYWTNQTSTGTLTGNLTDGNKGDVTVAFAGEQWTINNNVVTQNKLATDAVIESKIYAGSVTEPKISNGAVTEAKIGTGAVTAGKIGNEAVTENKIGTGAVTVNKLGANAVSNAKLATMGALSVKVNPTNATGTPQDLQATTDNTVLIRSGTALVFGTVPNGATSASSANTNNTIVLRDSSGNFSAQNINANQVTATSFIGNANTASTLQTSRLISLAGDVTGSGNFNGGAPLSINTTLATVPVSKGGTGATTASDARTNLGINLASETISGLIELATNTETGTGTDTARAITPASLFSIFDRSINSNGWITLPGGLIIQWGLTPNTVGGGNTVHSHTFPKAFPTQAFVVVIGTSTSQAGTGTNGAQRMAQVSSWTRTGFIWFSDNLVDTGGNTIGIHYIAIGQ